jgi:hypothetical protein
MSNSLQIRQWRTRNPEKTLAHKLVFLEIRARRMKRKCCEICRNPKSEAYHDDYTKPLKVRWLCKRHHSEAHKIINKKKSVQRFKTTKEKIRYLKLCLFCDQTMYCNLSSFKTKKYCNITCYGKMAEQMGWHNISLSTTDK